MGKQQSISTQPVKGMRDVYPEDMHYRNWLFAHWRAVSASYGYEEYDSAIVESEALYVRKAGDDITKELYGFEDKGGRRVALRPEMTPTLARMVMAKRGGLSLPLRWFSIPQCFRYQRMQKGRKREHFQWNMDVCGLKSVVAEVELMSAQAEFLRRVGFNVDGAAPEIQFKVSNRQILEHYLLSLGIDSTGFAATCIIIDKRDKIGDDQTIKSLLESGLSQIQATKIIDLLNIRGIDALEKAVGVHNPGFRSLKELLRYAEGMGISELIAIDLSIVRGLSYYTGTVWELFDTAGDIPRAIAGGGRYDRLMESLGGAPMPMVGFGFGDVVILLLLSDRGLLPPSPATAQDLVYPMDSAQFELANKIAASLRRKGRAVMVDYSERRFKHVIKLAEKVGAERMLILGESEVNQGIVKVRGLGPDRTEDTLDLSSFTD